MNASSELPFPGKAEFAREEFPIALDLNHRCVGA